MQLWEDVLSIAKDTGSRGHFLGSIVYISTGDSAAGFTRWQLIDGQQRVTTIMLMLIALRDHIRESVWKGSDTGPTARRIDAYFLKNDQEEGERRYKLVLRRDDQETLRALLDGPTPESNDLSNIMVNYEFFRDKLKNNVDPEVVYIGVSRLVVVDVTLERGIDDPQLIFESLNSTGLDLSESDLIRNFVLMRLPERDQSRLYQLYWHKIESLFKNTEKTFDSFIRDYLALKTSAAKQVRARDLYASFRKLFPELGNDAIAVGAVLKDLLEFAGYHAAFSVGKGGPEKLQDPLKRLRMLVDVPSVLIVRLLERHGNNKMSDGQLEEAILLIESYVFRRAVCSKQTRGYWQIFANLAYRIGDKDPLSDLEVGLASLGEIYSFPGDDEFIVALETDDIYTKRFCFDLLERLENYDTKEITDVHSYTIEHVMPQNERLSNGWKKMLGAKWRDVQREWVHRLGNLTLTGYNSTYSDREFVEKKTIPKGFAESAVRLNKYIREQKSWTAIQMEKRGKLLARRCLSIWAPLVVDEKLEQLRAAAQEREMRELAGKGDPSKLPMSGSARELFDMVRSRVEKIDKEVIQVVGNKSISYYNPQFFMELIPRKKGITLLLALDFNELDDPNDIARDAAQLKFLVNAEHDGGVFIRINTGELVQHAIPFIREAITRSSYSAPFT